MWDSYKQVIKKITDSCNLLS